MRLFATIQTCLRLQFERVKIAVSNECTDYLLSNERKTRALKHCFQRAARHLHWQWGCHRVSYGRIDEQSTQKHNINVLYMQ